MAKAYAEMIRARDAVYVNNGRIPGPIARTLAGTTRQQRQDICDKFLPTDTAAFKATYGDVNAVSIIREYGFRLDTITTGGVPSVVWNGGDNRFYQGQPGVYNHTNGQVVTGQGYSMLAMSVDLNTNLPLQSGQSLTEFITVHSHPALPGGFGPPSDPGDITNMANRPLQQGGVVFDGSSHQVYFYAKTGARTKLTFDEMRERLQCR